MKRMIQRDGTREPPIDWHKSVRSGLFSVLLLVSTLLIAFVDTLVGVGLLGCVVALFTFMPARTQTTYVEGQLQGESGTNQFEKVEPGDEYAGVALAVSSKSIGDLEKKELTQQARVRRAFPLKLYAAETQVGAADAAAFPRKRPECDMFC
jgi:hypothetical protein